MNSQIIETIKKYEVPGDLLLKMFPQLLSHDPERVQENRGLITRRWNDKFGIALSLNHHADTASAW